MKNMSARQFALSVPLPPEQLNRYLLGRNEPTHRTIKKIQDKYPDFRPYDDEGIPVNTRIDKDAQQPSSQLLDEKERIIKEKELRIAILERLIKEKDERLSERGQFSSLQRQIKNLEHALSLIEQKQAARASVKSVTKRQ